MSHPFFNPTALKVVSSRVRLLLSVVLLVTLFPVTSSAAVPTAPSIGTIVPGNGYLEVPFSGASGATSIEYSTDGGITWNARFTGIAAGSTATWSPLTIHGLTNGETYSVKLRAKNADGISTESDAVSATVNPNSRISASHAHLQGAYVEIGVRPNGAFGSSAGSLYGFHSSEGSCLGFRVDRQKNGWRSPIGNATSGFTNIDDGDYFCPGSPYEGWSLKVGDSGTTAFNSDQGTAINGAVYDLTRGSNDQSVVWSGSAYQGIVVTQTSIVPNTGQSLHVDIVLRNSTGSTISNIYYGRGYDPDNSTGGSSGTATSSSLNKVNEPGGEGKIAEVQARFASGAKVFLRSTDSRARAAARTSNCCTASVADPLEIWGTSASWIQTTDELASADRQVGVAVKVPSLAPGESTSFRISYVLTQEDASSPSVSTGSATEVGAGTTATLNGTVNPNGQASTVVFEYGTDSLLGGTKTTVTADQSPISGASTGSASIALTGLSPGTTYYYRIKATNDTGESIGVIQSFTPIASPTVVVDSASNIGDYTATLNARVNPGGGSAGSLIFILSDSTNLSSGSIVTFGASPGSISGTTETIISVDVGSLGGGITYYYRASATNEAGTTDSSIISFTTTPAPVVSTGSAINLSAGSRSARLTGTLDSLGVSTGSITFQYGTSISFGSYSESRTTPNEVTSAGSTSVYVDIDGLSLGTTYYYRLFASNANGSNTGAIGNFSLADLPNLTTGSASLSGTTANFSGTINPNGAAISSLRIYYATTSVGVGSSTAYVTVSTTGLVGTSDYNLSGSLSGLTPGSTYYYQVRATNSEGTTLGAVESFTVGAADVTAPTVSISATSSVSKTANFTVTITFSEEVTGFSSSDLIVSGSSAGWAKGAAATSDSITYTILLSSTPSTGVGSLYLNINAGAATDTSGNISEAATSVTVSVLDSAAFTITYFVGSATSGTAPSSGTYTSGGSPYTVLSTGSLARSGYTISGWNTQAGGGGTSYFAGSTYSTDANLDLYPLLILALTEGLTPTFDTPSPLEGGFTVRITNYNLNYTWTTSVSGGYQVELESGGLLRVTGINNSGYEALVTVTTSRSGYSSKSASVTGASRGASPEVNFREVTPPTVTVAGETITCICGDYRYVSRGWMERPSDIQAVIYTLILDEAPVAVASYDPNKVLAPWLAPIIDSSAYKPIVDSKKAVFTSPRTFTTARCEVLVYEPPTIHLARSNVWIR